MYKSYYFNKKSYLHYLIKSIENSPFIPPNMKKFHLYFFRYRFLLFYIIIGGFSLIIELIISRTLISYGTPYFIAITIGFIIGLLTAFSLNVRFNFHIAPGKRKKALIYFFFISVVSFFTQFFLRKQLLTVGVNMEASRFIIAGLFSVISYFLHRHFSFREFKKVGVAIYADGVEDIQLIYNKIADVSDFIHIDIVDTTFNANCKEVKAYRAEVVRAYWQNKKIEVHIMSKNPSIWLNDLLPYVDVIYIHLSINEDIEEVINRINTKGVNAGIAVGINDDLSLVANYLNKKLINHILLLSIPQPGFSGQKFDSSALTILEELNNHKERANFDICVDGGVNISTVKYLNVESVVSGSYILSAANPILNIMHLQTSGEYAKY